MNYGTCHGGPLNKKQLADMADVFPIWHHPTTGKVITGLTKAWWPPIGRYRFGDPGAGWTWESMPAPAQK